MILESVRAYCRQEVQEEAGLDKLFEVLGNDERGSLFLIGEHFVILSP